jgi:hypothetical protein
MLSYYSMAFEHKNKQLHTIQFSAIPSTPNSLDVSLKYSIKSSSYRYKWRKDLHNFEKCLIVNT